MQLANQRSSIPSHGLTGLTEGMSRTAIPGDMFSVYALVFYMARSAQQCYFLCDG